MLLFTFPPGTQILDTFEDADGNRTFIVRSMLGAPERWIRCGCTGAWLVWPPYSEVLRLAVDGMSAEQLKRAS